ncbi:MAG: hypothetical protein AAB319_00520, partial [Pseudomonadota bacterium]
DKLRSILPLRIALPRLEPFLAMNLAKEVQKDALVIRGGGAALASGIPPGSDTSRQLYDATKGIDQEFLAQLGGFPVGIVIRYEEIAPIRTRRIDCLLGAAYRILDAWRRTRGSRAAVRSAYSRIEFERLLHRLLQLYAQETQALSRSLRLPALLVPLRERLALSLYETMNDTALLLAREVAGSVYRYQRS